MSTYSSNDAEESSEEDGNVSASEEITPSPEVNRSHNSTVKSDAEKLNESESSDRVTGSGRLKKAQTRLDQTFSDDNDDVANSRYIKDKSSENLSPDVRKRNDRSTRDWNSSNSETPTKAELGDAVPKPCTKGETDNFSNLQSLLVIGIAFLIILFVAKLGPNDSEEPSPHPSVTFHQRLQDLKSQTSQNEKLWRIIMSTMKSHIENDNPIQPNVIMLASTPRAAKTREHLAKVIAAAYSVRCGDRHPVLVFGTEYAKLSHFDAKEKVDEKIHGGLGAGACAAVVSNFEALPPASTTVFYQFCENDFAPYKNASVIFTLEVNHGAWDADNQYELLRKEGTPSPRHWDNIVDAFLHHSLGTRDLSGTMKKDMIAGLLTRITPSVVWVTADENFTD